MDFNDNFSDIQLKLGLSPVSSQDGEDWGPVHVREPSVPAEESPIAVSGRRRVRGIPAPEDEYISQALEARFMGEEDVRGQQDRRRDWLLAAEALADLEDITAAPPGNAYVPPAPRRARPRQPAMLDVLFK